MTTFFQEELPPQVWDPVKSEVTVVFQEGIFITDSVEIAAHLVNAGYTYEGDLPSSKEGLPSLSTRKAKPMVRKKK